MTETITSLFNITASALGQRWALRELDERLALTMSGIDRVYALQAGRELRVHVHENPFSVPAAPFPSPGERRPAAETASHVSAATLSRPAPEAREMEIV